MPDKKYVRVKEHVRSMPKIEKKKKSVKPPQDTSKCTEYDCANHYYNAQDQLNCRGYFDFIPKPWRCSEDGKFSPHVR
jgi:hypothetical protein